MTITKTLRYLAFTVACVALAGCQTTPLTHTNPTIVSVKKIWDQGGHNAFTDLIRFHNRWFCTFRESKSHLEGDGKIRVLTSTDGDTWQSAALVIEEGVDLRDPKFSITPDHRLMLVCGGSVHDGKKVRERQPRVAFSPDGFVWSAPQRVLGANDWLWRVTWHDHRAYGIVYSPPIASKIAGDTNRWAARLVASDDGIHYHDVASFQIPNQPNEATARFLKNGDCVVLIRREAADRNAWIGLSSVPYTDWKWKSAGLFVGGPDFIVLKDGTMIAAGRELNPAPIGAKTFVGRMDLQSVTPEIVLPSGGDCSYPGLVYHDGFLWVSYYSSHEGKTSIYLAKLKL